MREGDRSATLCAGDIPQGAAALSGILALRLAGIRPTDRLERCGTGVQELTAVKPESLVPDAKLHASAIGIDGCVTEGRLQATSPPDLV